VSWSNWLFRRHDRGQDSLEQRIQELADMYVEVGFEIAKIKALLRSTKKIDLTPDQLARLTIEERLIMLASSQQYLAREVSDLKAIVNGQSGKIG
jgi:hypothetical protein